MQVPPRLCARADMFLSPCPAVGTSVTPVPSSTSENESQPFSTTTTASAEDARACRAGVGERLGQDLEELVADNVQGRLRPRGHGTGTRGGGKKPELLVLLVG